MRHATDFHREIVSEMGELGVLGPTIKGKTNKKTNAPPFLLFSCLLLYFTDYT